MPGLIHGLDPAKIAANLERARERAGEGVEILAATKYVPLEEMGALAEAGRRRWSARTASRTSPPSTSAGATPSSGTSSATCRAAR